MRLILTLALSLTAMTAFADQCQWNSASDATAARQLINLHKEIMFFQAGGSDKPSFIAEVSAVKTAQATMSGQQYPYRTVVLTIGGRDQEVDLAYTYVRTGPDIFANIAHLVGCPASGAITFIQTTNRNQKIQHFYDGTGQRVDTATTSAQNTTTTNTGRIPASAPKH